MQFEPMTSAIPVSVPSTFFIHALSFLSALWCDRLCTESVKAMAFTLSMIPLQLWSWIEKRTVHRGLLNIWPEPVYNATTDTTITQTNQIS